MKCFALITALAAVALAAPAKRDMVKVTELQTVTATVTVDSTVIVWVDGATAVSTETIGSSPTPSAAAPVQRKNKDENKEPAAQPSTPTTVSTSSSISVYVAPTPAAPSTTVPITTSAAAPTTPATTYAAPSPSAYSAPAPVQAPSPAASSVAAPAYEAPASSGGSNGCDSYSSGASCSGTKFSWYDPGMGACGQTHGGDAMIFAYPAAKFSAMTPNGNPNNNPLCGKKITITAYDGSKVTATLVDSCPGCSSGQHLDLSPALWDKVSNGDPTADGIASGYTWEWQ